MIPTQDCLLEAVRRWAKAQVAWAALAELILPQVCPLVVLEHLAVVWSWAAWVVVWAWAGE